MALIKPMNSNESELPRGVIVPLEKLSDQALSGLIDEFILREGTDYGRSEFTLEQKHEQIKKQLNSGNILIVFDSTEETCSIIRKESLPKELRNPHEPN